LREPFDSAGTRNGSAISGKEMPRDGEQFCRDPIIIFRTKVRKLYIYE
jgi:hypothetical protein